MPRFSTKRYPQILAQMIAKIVSRTDLSDVSDTSVIKHLLAAAARSDAEIYYNMSLLLDLFSIDRATGEDLDARAAEIQPGVVTRNEAAKATGQVVFSRAGATGTVNIAIGTKVKTSDGVEFVTTTAGQITAASPEQIAGHGVGRDSNLVSVVASLGGADGNVAANTIIKFVQKPSGVDEVTNPSACLNGADEETDVAFRARIKQYIASLPRCQVSALEAAVIGAQDENTGSTILYAKAVEDIINRGETTLYIDDGTGSVESSTAIAGTDLSATYTWNGTTTVSSGDTSEVEVGDFIGLNSDGQFFEITAVTPSVSVTITNPGALTIPTGATTSSINPELMTEGLAGPPADAAVGGEEYLFIENVPIKSTVSYSIVSSTRGILVENTDYYLNPTNGQVNFLTALSAGEYIWALYTHYTGLIQEAQKIIDGDPDDRETYPGYRAAGTRVFVLTPSVLIQTISVSLVISSGYDRTSVEAGVLAAIKEYVNTLGISGDLVRNELISKIMNVDGVYNCILSSPSADVILLDDELARTTDSNITVV